MKQTPTCNKYQKKIITIPNVLSFIRICMIPFIVWMYIWKKDYAMTCILVLISGLTDIVDGMIARKFNMISDVGKVLDPAADKATQIVIILMLMTRFPLMLMPFIISIIKELFMAITGYMVIRKCDIVLGAHWHGKAATVLTVAMIILHLVWYNIPSPASTVAIIICSAFILLSLGLYARRNFGYLFPKTEK